MCNTQAAFAGIGFAGNILQGIGAARQRETNAQTLEMNARGLDRDIAAEQESSAYEVARTREELARRLGASRAGFAANGLALSGSAAEVLNETAIEGDLDIAAIRWNSKSKQDSLAYERDTLRYSAGQERKGKTLAFLTPVISGAARFGTAAFG